MRREEYRDPALVLERRQNRTCLGCAKLEKNYWGGVTKWVCRIGKQKAALSVYEMNRCKKYTEGVFMTLDQSAHIEELLSTWYQWQIRQSHAETLAHFYRPTDHTCKAYETPLNDEDGEVGYQWADDRQSEQVQLCIDILTPDQRAAVSTSMRNKHSGRDVWSSVRAGAQHETYQAAKERLFPMLVARHLIKTTEPV